MVKSIIVITPTNGPGSLDDLVNIAVFGGESGNKGYECHVDAIKRHGKDFHKIEVEAELDADGIHIYLKSHKDIAKYAPLGAGFYESLFGVPKPTLIAALKDNKELAEFFN